MATDELTKGELFDAIFHNHWPLIQKHDAALRADRDRLREERDTLAAERQSWRRVAERLERELTEARTNHALLVDDYKDTQHDLAKLREEIAAKDAIFRAMYEFDGDPWTHGSADLGWNQVALSFICEWCLVSIDGNWPLRGDKPPHPDNGCPRNAIVAAPADAGKTCAPMEDWRGANEDWRKR